MINPEDSHIPAWFVWTMSDMGLHTLVAVTLTQERANKYRDLVHHQIQTETPPFAHTIRVWIDISMVNHLIGFSLEYADDRLLEELLNSGYRGAV